MNRYVLGWVLSGVGFLGLHGCVADTEPPIDRSAASDSELLERIEALGFDPSTAVVTADSISVEGDILLDRDKLLAGDYEDDGEALAGHEDDLIPKGYRFGRLVNSTNDGKIKVVTTSEIGNGYPGVVTGIFAAAESWSTGSSLSIRGANTGPSITVKMVDSLPSSCRSVGTTFACAEWPSNGKPGANIYLKRDISNITSCGWNTNVATMVISHEMGHAIGMEHPGFGTHIPGTATCDGAWWFCENLNLAPYPTIMDAATPSEIRSDCTVANPWVTQDDLDSVAAIYPE